MIAFARMFVVILFFQSLAPGVVEILAFPQTITKEEKQALLNSSHIRIDPRHVNKLEGKFAAFLMGLVPKDSNETLVLEDDEHGALVELLCQHHDWHQAQWYLRRFGITNEKGARLAWLNLTKKFKLFLVGADDFFRVVYGEREPNPEPVSKEVYMVYHINKQKYYQSIIKFGENFYNHLDEDHVRNAIEDNRSRGEIPERRYSTSETGEVSMAPFYTVGEDFTCSSSDQAVVRRDQNPTLRHLFD